MNVLFLVIIGVIVGVPKDGRGVLVGVLVLNCGVVLGVLVALLGVTVVWGPTTVITPVIEE